MNSLTTASQPVDSVGSGSQQASPDAAANSSVDASASATGDPQEADANEPTVSADAFATFVVSGARLKAQYFVGGGMRKFNTLIDTEFGLACQFRRLASDGSIRCVPGTAGISYFSDPECLQGVYVRTAECDLRPGGFAVRYTAAPTSCEADFETVESYRVGDVVEPAQIYHLQSGECVPADVTGIEVLEAQVMAADEFVRVEPVTLDVGGGLVARRIRAEDGAELTLDLQSMAGVPCRMVQDVCVPAGAAAAGTSYADEMCSELVGHVYNTTKCGEPTHAYAAQKLGDTCFVDGPVWPVIGSIDPVYSLSTGECAVRPPDDGFEYYELGEPSTEGLPKLTLGEFGESELRAKVYLGASGAIAANVPRIFTAEGTPCYMAPVPGGQRCLPRVVYSANVAGYADAACTESVYSTNAPCAGEAAPLLGDYGERPAACEPAPLTALSEAIPLAGSLFSLNGTDCVATKKTEGVAYYTAGKTLEFESFAEISTVIE
jgi:hypothetical protein